MQRIDAASLTDHTALGRLLSSLEREPAKAAELIASLPQPPAGVQRIGITGSPGVGKSTLIRRLVEGMLAAGKRTAVIAVDPTSPLTGGALLGDRVRIQGNDERLFIRSLGSRGSLGGLAYSTVNTARVLAAAGFERIIVETVGVGQTGNDVLGLVDTVVVMLSPESGDGLQMIKAGLLEFGDVFVVNKSDRPGADATLAELSFVVGSNPQGDAEQSAWTAPVLATTATEDTGTAALLEALEQHALWLARLSSDSPLRRSRIERELMFLLRARLSAETEALPAGKIADLVNRIQSGELSPVAACSQLLSLLGKALQD
jgi:LAO/AO transport system kinase